MVAGVTGSFYIDDFKDDSFVFKGCACHDGVGPLHAPSYSISTRLNGLGYPSNFSLAAVHPPLFVFGAGGELKLAVGANITEEVPAASAIKFLVA